MSEVITRHDDETLWEKYFVLNGKKNGEYIQFGYLDNYIIMKCNYINDMLEGDYITYHSNGNINMKTIYHNNILHGECRTYYHTGQINEKYDYVDGKINGDYICYDIMGNTVFRKKYIFGKCIECRDEYGNVIRICEKN